MKFYDTVTGTAMWGWGKGVTIFASKYKQLLEATSTEWLLHRMQFRPTSLQAKKAHGSGWVLPALRAARVREPCCPLVRSALMCAEAAAAADEEQESSTPSASVTPARTPGFVEGPALAASPNGAAAQVPLSAARVPVPAPAPPPEGFAAQVTASPVRLPPPGPAPAPSPSQHLFPSIGGVDTIQARVGSLVPGRLDKRKLPDAYGDEGHAPQRPRAAGSASEQDRSMPPEMGSSYSRAADGGSGSGTGSSNTSTPKATPRMHRAPPPHVQQQLPSPTRPSTASSSRHADPGSSSLSKAAATSGSRLHPKKGGDMTTPLLKIKKLGTARKRLVARLETLSSSRESLRALDAAHLHASEQAMYNLSTASRTFEPYRKEYTRLRVMFEAEDRAMLELQACEAMRKRGKEEVKGLEAEMGEVRARDGVLKRQIREERSRVMEGLEGLVSESDSEEESEVEEASGELHGQESGEEGDEDFGDGEEEVEDKDEYEGHEKEYEDDSESDDIQYMGVSRRRE